MEPAAGNSGRAQKTADGGSLEAPEQPVVTVADPTRADAYARTRETQTPVTLGWEPVALAAEPGAESLEADPAASQAAVVSEERTQNQPRMFSLFRFNRAALLITAVVLLLLALFIGAAVALYNNSRHNNLNSNDAGNYSTGKLSLGNLQPNEGLQIGSASQLSVNGLLKVNDSFVLVPTTTPTSPVAGQFYYNKADNSAYFYNGSQFVNLAPVHVSSIGGQSGAITLDTSLQLTGNGLGLSNALLQQIASAAANGGPRVTSLQGLTGDVTLNGGAGITINGNTISNSGLISLASGSGNLVITNDGAGHYTITDTGGGGSVTSLTGTPNQVNVSSSTGNVTLSLPQDIAVSSAPTFGGLTVTGSLAVQGANSLSLGAPSGNTGSIKLFNASNGNTLTLQSGASTGNLTFTLPVSDGSNGACLMTNGAGVLSFQTCTGGPGGGVTSVNGQSGIVNINNASGSGSTITIDNAKADGTTKGIATFNATNFTDNGSGVINTVQDINSTASPTFGGLTVNGTTTTSTLNATSSIQLNGVNINTAGTLSNVAYLNGTGPQTFTGNNKFTGTLAVQTTSPTAFQVQDTTGTSNLLVVNTATNRVGIGTLGPGYKLDVQGGDINTSGIYRVNGAQISSADLSNDANLAKLNAANVFTAANTFNSTVEIQGSNSLTLGSGSNAGSIIFRDGSTANTGTLQLGGALSGNATYNLPVATGSQTVCTVESGNCAGSGSGITGSGTVNRLAKFTGGQAVGDSNISDDGSVVTVSTGQVIQGAAGLTLGNTGVNGQLVFKNSSNANTLTLQSGATTGNLVLTLPTADGSNGNCLKTNGSGILTFSACTGGAGGGVTSLNTLTGVLDLVGTANQIDVNSAGSTITLSLPQNISTGSNATFRTVTLNGQAASDTLITANAVSGATGNLMDLKTNGVSQFTVDPSGNVNATGQYQINGVQISSSNLSDGSNLAKLNGTGPQTFTGNNKFTGTVLTQLDSPNAFQIQNAAGTSNLFNADTTTSRIGIGTNTPGYTLDVNGDVNTTGVYRINGVAICTTGGCTPSGGSGSYIQNGTTPQTADFNITGTGVISTSLTTPLVTSTGALAITGGTTLSLQSTGANGVTLDSGTTGAVDIGTGANAKTITIGNSTTNSQINLVAGSGQGAAGDINIGANAIASGNREINIGSTGSTAGSNTVLIATSNNASYSQAVTIGSNAAGNSTTTLQSGSTGAVNINSVGASTLASTTHIADTTNATGAQVVTIGSKAANSGNNTTIQGGSGSGAVSIQTAASGTISVGTSGVANTIQIGNTSGAVAQTINVGTNGTASSTSNVTIGSTIGGTTTLQNSSGIALNAPAITTNATTVALLNTTATTINFGGAASTLNIGPGGSTATSINLAGGSGATGCTVDGATGNLTCSGNISSTATSGTQGWWTRTGNYLEPATTGDNIQTTNAVSGSTISMLTSGSSAYISNVSSADSDWAVATQVSGDANRRFILYSDGYMEWGNGTAVQDTNLYRNGAGVLATDGWFELIGGGSVLLDGGYLQQTNASATTDIFLDSGLSGDTVSRYRVNADGTISWGGGSGARDTNLYRGAAGQLNTDGSLFVNNNVGVGGTVNVQGNALTTSSTTFDLLNTTATTLNIGGAVGAGGINLAGGSSSTGCTLNGATGDFTCSGNISSTATSGTQGWWTRSGTNLQPTNSGDSLTSIGGITGSSALAIAAGGTAQNLVLNGSTTGQVQIGGTSTGNILLGGGSGSTGCTLTNSNGDYTCSGGFTSGSNGSSGQLSLDRGDGTKSFSLSNINDEIRSYANGGNSSYTWYTTTGSLQLSMTLTSAGQLQLATQGSTGGLKIGGDATLYRSAANELTTNSNIVVQGGSLITNQTTANLFNTTATTLNVGGAATTLNIGPGGSTATSINLAGGSGATGCTVDGATGNLTCTGTITGSNPTTNYWSRIGTTLQPATAGDNITTTGNISTTGTGTITSAGLLTGSAGATISGGAINLNNNSNFATNINTGTSTGAVSIGNTSAGGVVTIASSGSNSININPGGGSNTGVLVKPGTNSTAAFQVQSAGGASLFAADTSGMNVIMQSGYSGETNTWASTSSLPSPGREGNGVLIANGYIYSFAGSVSGGGLITTVSYAKINANGTIGTWANTTSIGGAGSDTPGAVFSNGYIYVLGGVGLSTIYYAKPAPDGTISGWTTASTTMPASQQSGSGVAANNGYIYLVGGGTGTTATVYAKQNADGSLGTFTSTGATLPAARTALQSAVANGYIYAFGGWSGSTSTSTVYRASINSNGTLGSWSATGLTAMPFTRHSFAIALANGYVYLMGGISSASSVNANPVTTNTIMFAHINADGTISSWTTSTHGVGDPNGLRWVNGAAANGYLYTVGGDDGSGNTGPVQSVYYAAVSRVQVAGSLDLVGINGGDLANPGTGGTLTAGDTNVIGAFQVQGNANFAQGVGISGSLSVGGDVAIKSLANSTTAFQIQNSSGTALLTADTSTMKVTVSTLAVTGTITLSGHIITSGTTPTCARNATTIGSAGTCTISGNDQAGTITLTTTNQTQTAGIFATITFSSAYGSAPRVIVTPSNQNAGSKDPYSDNKTTTTFDIGGLAALSQGTTHTFDYIVMQ